LMLLAICLPLATSAAMRKSSIRESGLIYPFSQPCHCCCQCDCGSFFKG
jgi:hypothetical protein